METSQSLRMPDNTSAPFQDGMAGTIHSPPPAHRVHRTIHPSLTICCGWLRPLHCVRPSIDSVYIVECSRVRTCWFAISSVIKGTIRSSINFPIQWLSISCHAIHLFWQRIETPRSVMVFLDLAAVGLGLRFATKKILRKPLRINNYLVT